MRARFFNQDNLQGFMGGFLVGFSSGQGHAVIEQGQNYQSSWLTKSAPAILAFVVIFMNGNNNIIGRLPDNALPALMGFGLGFLAGHATAPKLSLSTRAKF